MKKIDLVLLASLGVLGAISVYFSRSPEAGRILSLAAWQEAVQSTARENLWGALGATVGLTILGNLSPFPSPYVLAVFFLAAQPDPFFPGLVALIASGGAVIGETIAYWVGRGIRHAAKERSFEKVDQFQAVIATRPRFIYFLIYFAALTPLPDKVVMVPLGIARFSFKKALLCTWLGKLSMLEIVAYGGYLGVDALQKALGGESWVSGIATILIILLAVYAIFRMDWSRFAKAGTTPPPVASTPSSPDTAPGGPAPSPRPPR